MDEQTKALYTIDQLRGFLFPQDGKQEPADPVAAPFHAASHAHLEPGLFIAARKKIGSAGIFCEISALKPYNGYLFQKITLGYGEKLPPGTKEDFKVVRSGNIALRQHGTDHDEISIHLHYMPCGIAVQFNEWLGCDRLKPRTKAETGAGLQLVGHLLQEIRSGFTRDMLRTKIFMLQLDSIKGGDWNDIGGMFNSLAFTHQILARPANVADLQIPRMQ